MDNDSVMFVCTLRDSAWQRIVLSAATARGVTVARGFLR